MCEYSERIITACWTHSFVWLGLAWLVVRSDMDGWIDVVNLSFFHNFIAFVIESIVGTHGLVMFIDEVGEIEDGGKMYARDDEVWVSSRALPTFSSV
jgi:hypothetical protein